MYKCANFISPFSPILREKGVIKLLIHIIRELADLREDNTPAMLARY